MKRVERFREIRRLNRKLAASLLLFFLLLITGTVAADYSVNGLMKNEKGINIFSFNRQSGYFEINIMNSRLFFNTAYINKDIDKIRNVLSGLVGPN